MWRNLKPYLLVLPAISVIGLLFFGGFLLGFLESIGLYSLVGEREISFQPYVDLLQNADFRRSILYTLRITALSTLLSAFVGLALGLSFIQMKGIGRRILQFPMLIPHLAVAYLVALLLMQSGWISRLLFAFGWIDEIQDFPILVHESFGWGIISAYVWKESPFIAFMLVPVLLRIQDQWGQVARILGAGRWAYFREIVLPLLMPSWLAASFIVFAFKFSAFEIPLLLGVTYPQMISVFAYQLFSGDIVNERPLALALNILIAFITALLGLLAYRLSKSWLGEESRGWN
ncbi:ABC transporter permease [Ammoniphilus oxalaticus]|uniref:ABC transporter permease n=2 Tax=Ammoniphilus oxalaticus TaxID=66863 RepID=A0A419SFC6_9BACL|nr:ABC transporter permease [Ammoniphilus oxalaticus]